MKDMLKRFIFVFVAAPTSLVLGLGAIAWAILMPIGWVLLGDWYAEAPVRFIDSIFDRFLEYL